MFRKLFLIFLFIGLVGTAQAAVSFSQTGGTSGLTSATYDLPSLYSAMVTRYNESYVQSSVMNETSPKHWEFRSALNVPIGMTFYINNTTCEELRIGKNKDGFALNGFIQLNNVSVIGWNFNESRPYDFTENGGKNILYNESHDCYFANMDLINYGYQMGYAIQNLSFSNITCQYFSNGINWQKSENVTVDGVTVLDGDRVSGGALNYCYANNSTFSNIYTDNITTLHKDWNAGSFGIHVVGSGNTIRDFYVNVSGWTGVAVGNIYGNGNNHVYNGTILNAGHNGFESPSDNSIVENITIAGSGMKGLLHVFHQNFYVAPDYPIIQSYNTTYKNITCDGDIFTIGPFCTNITVQDSTFRNEGDKGIEVSSSSFVTLINCTYDNCTGAVQISDDPRGGIFANCTNNTTIIDDKKMGTIPSINNINAEDVKIINSNLNTVIQSNIFVSGSIYKSYYIDVRYIDAANSPLGGTLNVANQEDGSNTTSSDGYGNTKSEFLLSTGRTSLPSNRLDTAAIQDVKYLTDPRSSTFHNYTINASSESGNVILDNVNPDTRWYRENPLNSKYTITAILNNSEGLHFTGYAPTVEYNNFNNGDSIKFQIWANEPLTNVVWKKDGIELQNSTSTTYETTISEAPITVDITGQSETGTITKTWTIDPNQVVEPIPDPEPEPDPEDPVIVRYPPVANFTSDVTTGAIPLKVNFTDTSTNATSWYWDFDNNGVIDSTLQNPTFIYMTQGNYTVKLTTSNADGMNVSTQINYIQVQGRTGIILRIWNWFSNIFTFLTGVAING